jgi:hypothetical protein
LSKAKRLAAATAFARVDLPRHSSTCSHFEWFGRDTSFLGFIQAGQVVDILEEFLRRSFLA